MGGIGWQQQDVSLPNGCTLPLAYPVDVLQYHVAFQLVEELIARVEHRVRWKGQSVRAIHPFDPDDYALLQAIHRGEFNITGLS